MGLACSQVGIFYYFSLSSGNPDVPMNFNDINDLKKNGFVGFKPMVDLFVDSSGVPAIMGVYLVLSIDKSTPTFLHVGTGGHFKGKNPNVTVEELKRNWITDSVVVYIGKAGGLSSSATLRSRLKQYFSFGQGKNIGHWGGRFIWQLASSKDLVVCWKPLDKEEPKTVEVQLIKEFVTRYGGRPFANLAD